MQERRQKQEDPEVELISGGELNLEGDMNPEGDLVEQERREVSEPHHLEGVGALEDSTPAKSGSMR